MENDKKGFSLVLIINTLVISSVFFTVLISMYAGYQVNKSSLITSYLDSNEQYAKKLASNTNQLLNTMQSNIQTIADIYERESTLSDAALNDLFEVNKQFFNSIFIVDENRVLQTMFPRNLGHIGEQLTSDPSKQAVALKEPFISEPYRAITGKLIVLISAPIYDQFGVYKGFIGGSIHLQETNALSNVLNNHFFSNDSYVYVVNRDGMLIFHPDLNRLGQNVLYNAAVKMVVTGKSGSQEVMNVKGLPFFAGYASEKNSGWGIVSQTPTSIIHGPLNALLQRILLLSFPFFLMVLILGWFIAARVAKPLSLLAKFTEEVFLNVNGHSELPDIKTKTYELRQLYRGAKIAVSRMNNQIKDLKIEIETDGLTGIANRKPFDFVLTTFIRNHIPFSLIFIDVDHFKMINDSYGHTAGDDVLRLIATRDLSPEENLCFRYGGEEFGFIVKSADREVVKDVAESLRTTVEKIKNPTGRPITISLGVASFPNHGLDAKDLVSHADNALYVSKARGRNRTTIYESEGC